MAPRRKRSRKPRLAVDPDSSDSDGDGSDAAAMPLTRRLRPGDISAAAAARARGAAAEAEADAHSEESMDESADELSADDSVLAGKKGKRAAAAGHADEPARKKRRGADGAEAGDEDDSDGGSDGDDDDEDGEEDDEEGEEETKSDDEDEEDSDDDDSDEEEAAPAKARKPAGGMHLSKPIVPKRRRWTLTMAIPGSIILNVKTHELQTLLAGQIARAAAVFCVDEIVVYHDAATRRKSKSFDPDAFLAHLLQYSESPQYLRKEAFPFHPNLKFAGLLHPLDTPHHMRQSDLAPYREGIVIDRPVRRKEGSWVNAGLHRPVRIAKRIKPGVRLTLKMDYSGMYPRAEVVSPDEPRTAKGLYWGYTVRIAKSFSEVWSGCPHKGGYDVCVGTSDKGSDIYDPEFALPRFRNLLVVFGGVVGLEACVDADEEIDIGGEDVSCLFDAYINACPGQGSGTIRTEEAVLVSLSALRPHVLRAGR
eukprot:PLAT9349.1.p1 GENE.PLAT9349.1~~PLAT9349.1.p1  ORF type:complete len:479 (-),score=184.34 PLAT9349.1:29-1465(-)